MSVDGPRGVGQELRLVHPYLVQSRREEGPRLTSVKGVLSIMCSPACMFSLLCVAELPHPPALPPLCTCPPAPVLCSLPGLVIKQLPTFFGALPSAA